MNTYLLLLCEFITSISVSLGVLYVISTPLLNVLIRICPDEQAATFWLSYTKVTLMLLPLLFVISMDIFSHFDDPMDSLRLGLMAVLAGLLIGLYSIGKRLGKFVIAPQHAEDKS